jgi:hypothetical protein
VASKEVRMLMTEPMWSVLAALDAEGQERRLASSAEILQ